MLRTNVKLTIDSQKRVRMSLFFYFFFMGLCFSSWASRIPEIKSALGLDEASWGTMLLMIPLGQVVGMSLSGWLISRVGSNRVALWATIGYALTLFSIGIAPTEAMFIASLIIFGFFGNFCNISMNTQGVIIENFYARPIMASFHGGWSLAGLLGGLIGLAMTMLHIPTSIHFASVSLIIILGVLSQYHNLQHDATPRMAKDENEKKEKARPEFFLILLGVIGFFGWAAEGTMADWNGIYLKEVVGIEESLTPIGLTLYMVTMAFGRFVMDKGVARWGHRVVLCFCGAAIFVGMFLAALVPTFVCSLIGFMVVGLGTCGVIPVLYSIAGKKTKIHPGKALTLVSTISFAGFLIGPPIIGYIAQATNLRYSFALIGIFGLLCLIMSSYIKILRKEEL